VDIKKMPRAHRNGDMRFCGAGTIVIGNQTVFVNDRLWAVDGDVDSHTGGNLKAVTGPPTIYIQNKLIICAVGDIAAPDNDPKIHPTGPTNPLQASPNVFTYDGTGGGTVV
jgi:hypothetical protein